MVMDVICYVKVSHKYLSEVVLTKLACSFSRCGFSKILNFILVPSVFFRWVFPVLGIGTCLT